MENIRSEIDNHIENADQKIFLNIVTKSFTILLSVKVDNSKKIIKIVKLIVSRALKNWS